MRIDERIKASMATKVKDITPYVMFVSQLAMPKNYNEWMLQEHEADAVEPVWQTDQEILRTLKAGFGGAFPPTFNAQAYLAQSKKLFEKEIKAYRLYMRLQAFGYIPNNIMPQVEYILTH